MANPYYPKSGSGRTYYSTTNVTEPDMRNELINTIEGSFPEIAKGHYAILRIMDRDSNGNLVECPCTSKLGEQDRDRFCPVCIKGDSYIWTNVGVKLIKDIIPGESVLCMDNKEHIVTDIHGRLYDGDIVKLFVHGRSNIPLELTSDHIVFVIRPQLCHQKKSFNKICIPEYCGLQKATQKNHCKTKKERFNLNILEIKANEIQEGDYVLTPKTRTQEDFIDEIEIDWNKYITRKGKIPKELPSRFKIDNDFLYFIGLYVAEGSGDSPGKRSRSVCFSLHENEINIANDLLRIAKDKFKLDGVINRKKNSKAIIVTFFNAVLSRWLHDICGRYSNFKQIPRFVWKLQSNQQCTFLNAFMLGDGHFDASNNRSKCGIVSRRLAEELYMLATINHYFPSIRFRSSRTGSDGTYHSDAWYIEWGNYYKNQRTKWRSKFSFNNFYFSRVKKIIKNKEKCAVYDLTVQDNHNFVANGILIHNCWGEGFTWVESWTKIYNLTEASQDITNALLDKIFPPGYMKAPAVTFYLKYDDQLTEEDKVIEVSLDDSGEVNLPIVRTCLYKITYIWNYRADNGKLEYNKLFGHKDFPKYLNAPTVP